ncbi:uncharacterized protein LOC134180327 [Corticium candelabrum]|uniref:uncharacterized protein LOC134180327 n=1 Tax=Corticium candelabrum TaxID=121492 RepID=UPI002E275388|nr:uncharacterized protein LOC134180327 [Corticium candelabrum]
MSCRVRGDLYMTCGDVSSGVLIRKRGSGPVTYVIAHRDACNSEFECMGGGCSSKGVFTGHYRIVGVDNVSENTTSFFPGTSSIQTMNLSSSLTGLSLHNASSFLTRYHMKSVISMNLPGMESESLVVNSTVISLSPTGYWGTDSLFVSSMVSVSPTGYLGEPDVKPVGEKGSGSLNVLSSYVVLGCVFLSIF